MKKILLLISVCLTATMVSCQFEKDIDLETFGGKGLEFVHFASPSASWVVSATDESFTHEVDFACTYLYDKDVTYKVSVDPEGTTGVEGVDYSLVTKSVTIRAGEYSGEIPVKVLYETTGLGFTLTLALDVDDAKVNPAYGNTITIKVGTDKIDYNWEWLAGKWNAQDYVSGAPDGDSYSVIIKQGEDENTCIISNVWGAGVDLTSTVDFETKTISIPGNVLLYTHSTYGPLHFVAVDDNDEYYEDLTTPVIATMSPLGVTIRNWDLLLTEEAYAGYTWNGVTNTVLSR